MTQNDLKPCPFCGGNDLIVESYGVLESVSDSQLAEVECQDCHASVSYTSYDPLNDSASNGAIERWNSRQ